MERKELKKLIINNFDSYAKENGYLHRIYGSSLFWYKIENDILYSIGFETKSNGYHPIYLIQPLYMGFDCVVLSYSKDVSHCRYDKYFLSKDFSYVKTENNIENFKIHLNRNVNKRINKLCTPEKLTRNIPKRVFFISEYTRCELKAYSNLYIGNYNKAHDLFSKILPRSYNSSVITKVSNVLELLANNRDEIPSLIKNNISKTMTSLKLIY